jgi:hypothetical protein
MERKVSTVAELRDAAGQSEVRRIKVVNDLRDVPGFRLSPGQSLLAERAGTMLEFAPGGHGLELSTDNQVEGLELSADPARRALFNDTGVERLGRLVLRDLRVTGLVQLLAKDSVRSGHVEVENVHVVAADARAETPRPKGYGVEVIPGAFTLWNQHDDPAVTITADLIGLTAGQAGAPVRGCGVFVSGGGETGGRLTVRRLDTGAVYSDGGIAPGTPDRITGGVFVVSGAFVDRVRNHGPVTTYGANDMVLDNWGTVGEWIADDKITSYGQSGIGFVNFGTIDVLQVNAPIETFNLGARGFNVYTGTVRSAEFERIVTHGDGAVGLQISRPVGEIKVRRGIETYGATGKSLVKGVVTTLSAIGLSIRPGGSVRRLTIGGGLTAHGAGINPLELHGVVETLEISGGIASLGGGFETI